MMKTPITAPVMPAVLKQADTQRTTLATVQQCWRTLVGRTLAAHSRPVSLRRGRLIVHVEHPGDNFALSFRRAELTSQLQAQTDGRVEELIIRAGELTRRTRPEGGRGRPRRARRRT